MSILVTGGAGYIGSHAAHALADRDEPIVVLDNLTSGVQSFVPRSAQFVEGSVGNPRLVRQVIQDHKVESVLHFAGSISVPDSIDQPLGYYQNNTVNSAALIRACVDEGVANFIFSSTAAVYSCTDLAPVTEEALTNPLNPYGRSKLMVEWILADAARAHRIRYVALRYFNVAGIDPNGRAGQPDRQTAHLIKRAAQVAIGRADQLDIFGSDYPTHDGTGVRDYIHICDLVDAHVLALDHLRTGGGSSIYNCGYGSGSSVLDVVCAFERVTGRQMPVRYAPRRPGDAPSVVADATRLRETLAWRPQFDCLDTIARSALEWERRR